MLQGFFNYDNPVWRFIGKLGDLILLNILWIVCSIPVFTIGASTTAVYYVTLKLARDEGDSTIRSFFHSFKSNFRQATAIWLILLAAGIVLGIDFWFFATGQMGIGGTVYALKIVGTLLTFLGSFYLMSTTTYTGKLVAALTASGMNPKVGYLILASLNVVPQMQRRMSVIQEAQNARGVETKGTMMSRLKAYIPLLGPVVMSSLTDAQERGMTLETRGFGIKGVKPTTYVEVTVSASDRVCKTCLVLFFVAVLAVSILMRLHVI